MCVCRKDKTGLLQREKMCICVCRACDCCCNLLSPDSRSYYSCRYGAQGFIDTSNETQSGQMPVCAACSCLRPSCVMSVHVLFLCVYVTELTSHVKTDLIACYKVFVYFITCMHAYAC